NVHVHDSCGHVQCRPEWRQSRGPDGFDPVAGELWTGGNEHRGHQSRWRRRSGRSDRRAVRIRVSVSVNATQAEKLPAIGFIGLGIMGRPMAGHLLAAGHALFVNTRTRSTANELVSGGATWCASAAQVGQRCEILITMLPDTPDVERVLLGDNGAAQ